MTTPATVRDLSELRAILTVSEVAAVIQVAPPKIYDLIRSGELPSVRVGNQYRVTRAALAKFLGVCEDDLADAREKRRAEVEALLARYRVAADECSRVTARLLELGVAVTEPRP